MKKAGGYKKNTFMKKKNEDKNSQVYKWKEIVKADQSRSCSSQAQNQQKQTEINFFCGGKPDCDHVFSSPLLHENLKEKNVSNYSFGENAKPEVSPEKQKKANDESGVVYNERARQEQKLTNTDSSLVVKQLSSNLEPFTLQDSHQNEQNLDRKGMKAKDAKDLEEKQELNVRGEESQVHIKTRPLDLSSGLEFYYKIIELVEGKDKKSSRIRLALCLLYITGLRISTLLLLTGLHIQCLLTFRKCEIFIKKLGSTNYYHRVFIGTLGLNLLKDCFPDFKILMEGKKSDDYLFTAYNKKQKILRTDKALSRVTLNIDINNILKKASEEFDIKIRSHSFRVISGMLTHGTPIESAQIICKDRKTTAYYHQPKRSRKEVNQIITTVKQDRKLSVYSGINKMVLKPYFLLSDLYKNARNEFYKEISALKEKLNWINFCYLLLNKRIKAYN